MIANIKCTTQMNSSLYSFEKNRCTVFSWTLCKSLSRTFSCFNHCRALVLVIYGCWFSCSSDLPASKVSLENIYDRVALFRSLWNHSNYIYVLFYSQSNLNWNVIPFGHMMQISCCTGCKCKDLSTISIPTSNN